MGGASTVDPLGSTGSIIAIELVPEPNALVLLGIGLAFVATRRRRVKA